MEDARIKIEHLYWRPTGVERADAIIRIPIAGADAISVGEIA
jgi:hypothetical protein